jgi:hypothetical protein
MQIEPLKQKNKKFNFNIFFKKKNSALLIFNVQPKKSLTTVYGLKKLKELYLLCLS